MLRKAESDDNNMKGESLKKADEKHQRLRWLEKQDYIYPLRQQNDDKDYDDDGKKINFSFWNR